MPYYANNVGNSPYQGTANLCRRQHFVISMKFNMSTGRVCGPQEQVCSAAPAPVSAVKKAFKFYGTPNEPNRKSSQSTFS